MTEVFGLVELLGSEQDRGASGDPFLDQLPHLPAAERIQSGAAYRVLPDMITASGSGAAAVRLFDHKWRSWGPSS